MKTVSPMPALCDDTVSREEKISLLESAEVTGDMLAACAQYLLDRAVPLSLPGDPVDLCGTGGDKGGGVKTFNISTAAAFVLAASGVGVAKHGSRAVSSVSGSSDVLEALGILPCTTEAEAQKQFEKNNICFIAAPSFHPALKNLSALRKSLGKPTFLNLLGPLCNPARVRRQVIGVFDEKFLEPVIHAAKILRKTDVMAVHGEAGLDELTPCMATHVVFLRGGNVSRETIAKKGGEINDLRGGTAAENAEIIMKIFKGSPGIAADTVCLNAAAGMMVAEKVKNLEDGFLRAREIIASGAALKKLEDMR